MHKQLSEKQLAANGERSADCAFRSAAFASQATMTRGDGMGFAEAAIGEKMGQKDRTNPVRYLESRS
jgi:hypothetical protein